MSWKFNREWPKYEGGIMFFSLCRQKPSCNKSSGDIESKANAFVDETSHSKLGTIKTHETCRFHCAESLKFNNNLKPASQTPARKASNDM